MRKLASYKSILFTNFDALLDYMDNLGEKNIIAYEFSYYIRIFTKNRITEELYESLGKDSQSLYRPVNERLGMNYTSDFEFYSLAARQSHLTSGVHVHVEHPYDTIHGKNGESKQGEDALDVYHVNGEESDYNISQFINHKYLFEGLPVTHQGKKFYILEINYFYYDE